MNERNKNWRKAYQSAKLELDPARQSTLCKKARKLMQGRLIELACGSDVAEREAVEEALRDLWRVEQGMQEPDVQ